MCLRSEEGKPVEAQKKQQMRPVELDQLVLHPTQPAQHQRTPDYVFIAFVQQL